MPSCVFRRCTNYTATVRGKQVSFHTFPMNKMMKEKWVQVVRDQRREDDWMPTKSSRICSQHFVEREKYSTEKNIHKLKKTAVPVIKHEEYVEDAKNSSDGDSLKDVYISDNDSIFNFPINRFLETKMTNIDPEKEKPKMKSCDLGNQNQRVKKKCNNIRTILSNLKNKRFVTVDQYTELELKAEAVELTNRFIAMSKSKGKKYTPALRKFAITLHYYSAAAYKYFRQVFNGSLPHPRIISKWYENDSGDPGFSKQSLGILNKKHKSSGLRSICTLIANEIALRHQTTWTARKTAGLVDFGAGSQNSYGMATRAYIFTVVCMDQNWKIPIAYFLVNGLSAETRATLLKTCLSECYNVGVDIVAITFNGCAANKTAAVLLGCNLQNPFRLKTTFKHPECDRDVAIIFDPCHMMKLVRNAFEVKRLILDVNGNRIRWQLLINLVKLQKNKALNFTNKISPRYIKFRNEVMKFNLATEILSVRVANTLKLCNETIKSSMFVETEGTINFITIFSDLFDILNSKSSNLYSLKKPLSSQNANEVIAYLDKAKEYILGLTIFIKYMRVYKKGVNMHVIKKKVVESNTKTGFLGFLICIESLKHLYTTLVQEKRLRYIETIKLSQDHIYTIFSDIRRHDGYNNNPRALELKGMFKKILRHMEMKPSFSDNYIPVELNWTCSSAVQIINRISKREFDGENEILDNGNEYTESDQVIENNVQILSTLLNRERMKKTIAQIIGYISGWVSRKLSKVLECETCVISLFSNDKLWFHKLISVKNIGDLCFPTEDVFNICLKSEIILKNFSRQKGETIFPNRKDEVNLKNRILKSFMDCPIPFQSLEVHASDQPVNFNHQIHLIRAIIDTFVSVRLHCTYKNNYNPKNGFKRQKRKLRLFVI